MLEEDSFACRLRIERGEHPANKPQEEQLPDFFHAPKLATVDFRRVHTRPVDVVLQEQTTAKGG